MYASIEECQEYLGIDQSDDSLILRLLMAVTKYVEKRTGRVFESAKDTARFIPFDGDHINGRDLFLPTDLAQITSIVNGDGSLILPTAYVTDPRYSLPFWKLTLKRNSGVSWLPGDDPDEAIAITGRWAYSVEVPEDIRQGVIRMVAWSYRQKDNSGGENDRPIRSSDGVVLLPSRIPSDVGSFVDPYIRYL